MNLDVVHDVQVLEWAAATDNEVVTEVVGSDGRTRHDCTSRNVLKGACTLQHLARRDEEAGGG